MQKTKDHANFGAHWADSLHSADSLMILLASRPEAPSPSQCSPHSYDSLPHRHQGGLDWKQPPLDCWQHDGLHYSNRRCALRCRRPRTALALLVYVVCVHLSLLDLLLCPLATAEWPLWSICSVSACAQCQDVHTVMCPCFLADQPRHPRTPASRDLPWSATHLCCAYLHASAYGRA